MVGDGPIVIFRVELSLQRQPGAAVPILEIVPALKIEAQLTSPTAASPPMLVAVEKTISIPVKASFQVKEGVSSAYRSRVAEATEILCARLATASLYLIPVVTAGMGQRRLVAVTPVA